MTGPVPIPAEESVRKTARIRTRIVVCGLIIWAAGIVVRLVQLQIFSYGKAKEQVTNQNRLETRILPERGTIFDRDGRIFAQISRSPSLWYAPTVKENPAAKMLPVKKLIPVLGLTPADIAGIRSQVEKGNKFVWIKRNIDEETVARVKALGLNGISSMEEPRRVYPQGRAAAHVLGAVDIDNEGQAGIELRFNEALRGEGGTQFIFRDGKKKEYQIKPLKAPVRGRDVFLTLDATIQYIAQREIEKAVADNQADWGAVIVSEPETGEILALASAPSYDPNRFSSADRESLYERAFRAQIEPGSTFKIVTAAAALENRRVASYETFDCRAGAIDVAGGPIRDHKPFGILSFSEVIAESSNIGTIQVGRRIGADLLYKAIKDFGFGEMTGIELPAEARGSIRAPKDWSGRSLDSLSVGYEIAVTPLQILQAVNIVANRGLRVPPRIVRTVDGRTARSAEDEAAPARIISAQTAEKLIDILERAVLDGTGTAAAIPGYAVAGKTGTSQIYDKAVGAYSLSRHTASFVGFVPADKPALSIIVVLNEPKNSAYYGGEVAAPVFREIALRVLRYRHVFPSSTGQAILASAARKESGR
jgi:cell division protein FtsI/penicillin-binding protein 2